MNIYPGAFADDRSKILDYAIPSSVRDMDDPQINHYDVYEWERDNQEPIGGVPQHRGGEFFSSVLWEIREEISNAAAEYNAFVAQEFIPSNVDFEGFREAMITVDLDAYNGNNVFEIQQIFFDHGIGDPPPVSITITGPSSVDLWSCETYGTIKTGGSGDFSYEWKLDGNFVGDNSNYIFCPTSTGTYPIEVTVTDNVTSDSDNDGMLVSVNGGMGQSLAEYEEAIPEKFAIHQNYPNPFNPETTIRYEIPEPSHVTLTVYDAMGREVRSIVNDVVQPGYHTATWDSRSNMGTVVSSGMYLYRFTATPAGGESEFTGITESNTMLLVK